MGACLKAKWVRIGLGLIVGGAAPLFLIIVASKLGFGDPNPNPVGPGLLAMVTFWPGFVCLVYGVIAEKRAQSKAGNPQ